MKLNAVVLLAVTFALCSTAYAQEGMRKGEWRYWGGDAGSTRYSALDQINATNARELQIAWRWQSLPGDGEPGVETWEKDSWAYTGNTGVWSMMSADPELGFVYLQRRLSRNRIRP
ncbi:MAG TPA: hypothetical protein VJS12_09400 [Steroidobacteraceae bacterium]|nr:hypothetical protein [Steroidobacteraceae bacterium]